MIQISNTATITALHYLMKYFVTLTHDMDPDLENPSAESLRSS